MTSYEKINRGHKGALDDPCTEFTARQAIRLCKLSKEKTVLDYGCSIGRAARVFQKSQCVVTGVDVVPENIELARPYCTAGVFLRERQDVPLPFEKQSFDCIYSSQVIEHLCRNDGDDFINESYSLLRNGG